jgi:hypothetical protein
MRGRPTILAWVVAVSMAGCAVAKPYVPYGGPAEITRGKPILLVDAVGNVFGLLSKLILFNWKVDNHAVSPHTEEILAAYLQSPGSMTEGTHFSLNEYAPGRALSRLVKNRKVAWPYRLLLGLPITLITDVLIPGRLFAGLLGGDSYNPFTDTVSIYSDLPSIALHEAGHTHDFNQHRWKGTSAATRLIPLVDLYHEYEATDEALRYVIETGARREEMESYKVLYPAYGTYVGAYTFIPGGFLVGALLGHIWGRSKAHARQQFYDEFDRVNNPG